jgi:hypothetical protein
MLLRVGLVLLFLAAASIARAASIVSEWLDDAIPDAIPIANEVAWEPTVGARLFAILSTAMYDTWSAYDPKAVAVVSGTALKNKGGLANEANKREAISHAAYTVLRTLAPQRGHALAKRMAELGYDPNANTAPAVLGRRAANAVLAKFREDGANETGGFADTTGYKTKGAEDPASWQPILAFGKPQLPTTPQWRRVMPFALTRADQFRPPPPPVPGSEAWRHQIAVLIDVSGTLTDAQKAAAEFWNEWGSSPSPHLIDLTRFVANVRDLRIDEEVKLFFVVSSALLDASIATWDAKYTYDYVRPITAIRSLGDVSIKAWRPSSLPAVLAYSTPETLRALDSTVIPAGVAEMRAAQWKPYLPTPSFPSYVAGHAAFCGAWARIMTLATGTSELDYRKTVKHLYVEQRQLSPPVTLDYPTYEAAAEACGQARILGGVHWPDDIERGLELGRKVGENAWNRAQQFLLGNASPATAALAALHPPFWFPQSGASGTKFPPSAGMAVDLAPSEAGTWRSIALDPMPAGDYELRLTVEVSGEEPVSLGMAIEPSGALRAAPLAASESVIPPTGAKATMTLPWSNDGSQSFAVSVTAGAADSASARVVVSAIDLVRVWPIAAGSPRYVEPSLAGRPEQ